MSKSLLVTGIAVITFGAGYALAGGFGGPDSGDDASSALHIPVALQRAWFPPDQRLRHRRPAPRRRAIRWAVDAPRRGAHRREDPGGLRIGSTRAPRCLPPSVGRSQCYGRTEGHGSMRTWRHWSSGIRTTTPPSSSNSGCSLFMSVPGLPPHRPAACSGLPWRHLEPITAGSCTGTRRSTGCSPRWTSF